MVNKSLFEQLDESIRLLRSGLVLLLLISFTSVTSGTLLSSSELEETTARGRMLAEYQLAVRDARKAIRLAYPTGGDGLRYIGRKTDAGWIVALGQLNERRDKFIVIYNAIRDSKSTGFTVAMHDPPLEVAGFHCLAAKAIDVALRDFSGPRFTEIAVVPTDSDQIYVYILPAQGKAGTYLFGGDVRYLISPDGSRIIDKHLMHKSIIEFMPSKNSRKSAAGFHTHVLSDVPEDSDISYVLTRKPSVPEIIRTRNYSFVVEVDGTIVRKE